jgi:hypothetical protein
VAQLKTATFTVRGTMPQSIRWKQVAEGEGFASVGSWAARALDAYLEARARAGRPIPLAWHRGRFPVLLEGGEPVTLPGFISPPFGAFRGGLGGPVGMGVHRYSLVYLEQRRILATLRSYRQCQALASDLARLWARWGGAEPVQDASAVLERHSSEAL